MCAHQVSGHLGIDLGAKSTTPSFKLGMEVQGSDGATYKYVQANGAVAEYAACKLDDTNEVLELTTTISGAEPTAVAVNGAADDSLSAFADNEYGWVVVSGPCKVLAAASCAADVKTYTTATAGVVDDTATDLIQGLKLIAANGGSQAAVGAFIAGRAFTNAQD